MSDDLQLQAKIREAVESGQLPKRLPDQVLGGRATGAVCAVCGFSTTREEVELELAFVPDGEPAMGPASYYAHPRCFFMLREELVRLLEVKPQPGT